MDNKYILTLFPNEELSVFQEELAALLNKFEAHIEPEPQFMKSTIRGSKEGEVLDVWSQVMKLIVYKKTPKNGVISPIQNEDLPQA